MPRYQHRKNNNKNKGLIDVKIYTRFEPAAFGEIRFAGELRVWASVRSFICCWIAIGWFRQTREMKRTGKVWPLTLPLPTSGISRDRYRE